MWGWQRILPWGFVACTCAVVGAVLREEAPPQTLILAALVIVALSGLWLWLRARR
jgi:uncharacterized membrane protein YfcA